MGGVAGISIGLLKEDQLCHSHECRVEVAHEDTDIQFVYDRNGIKWKCASRRQLHGETGIGWACIELDCRRRAGGILDHGFRFDTGCAGVVTSVDALPAVGAGNTFDTYVPVEQLGLPSQPGCGMAPVCPAPPLLSQIRACNRHSRLQHFL